MAHKKGVGSSKNGRESASKRLGVKIFGGQACKAGNINICLFLDLYQNFFNFVFVFIIFFWIINQKSLT